MADLPKYSCSGGSSLSSPKRVTSGSRTRGGSPQKRTSSGAPFPKMCATTMPSMRPEVVEAGDDFREIAGPAMLFVVGKKARRTIAVIDDLVTRGLEPINKPGGTQSRGGFLAAERKGCGARRRTDQGNLLRLTDDLDRQVRLPVLSYPAAARVLPRPERKMRDFLPVLRGVPPEGSTTNSQRRGAGAMVANSGGKVNRTSSRIRSKSR